MIFRHIQGTGPRVPTVKDQWLLMLCPCPAPLTQHAGLCLLQKSCELLSFALWMENTFYKTFNWSRILIRETFHRNSAHMGPMYLGKPQLESSVCIHTHVPMLPDKTSGYPPNDNVGCQQFVMETVVLSNLSLSVFVSLWINTQPSLQTERMCHISQGIQV